MLKNTDGTLSELHTKKHKSGVNVCQQELATAWASLLSKDTNWVTAKYKTNNWIVLDDTGTNGFPGLQQRCTSTALLFAGIRIQSCTIFLYYVGSDVGGMAKGRASLHRGAIEQVMNNTQYGYEITDGDLNEQDFQTFLVHKCRMTLQPDSTDSTTLGFDLVAPCCAEQTVAQTKSTHTQADQPTAPMKNNNQDQHQPPLSTTTVPTSTPTPTSTLSIRSQATFSSATECAHFVPNRLKPDICIECYQKIFAHCPEAVKNDALITAALEYSNKGRKTPSTVLPPTAQNSGGLYLGGYASVLNKAFLGRTANVTGIVNTARGLDMFGPVWVNGLQKIKDAGSIEFLELNWVDSETQTISELDLTTAVQFIHRHRSIQQGNVLVHCAQGKSRSTTCVLAYLLAKDLSLGVDDALQFVKTKRMMAKPNPHFMKQLHQHQKNGLFVRLHSLLVEQSSAQSLAQSSKQSLAQQSSKQSSEPKKGETKQSAPKMAAAKGAPKATDKCRSCGYDRTRHIATLPQHFCNPTTGAKRNIGELVLPSSNHQEWSYIVDVLSTPITTIEDLDTILTSFAALDPHKRTCTFFSTVPGSPDAGSFDFERFLTLGMPLMVKIALQMPDLFASDQPIPIYKMRSSWPVDDKSTRTQGKTLGKLSYTLTRLQCACLLAHSFFGSLKKPADVEPNDFRFTVTDLFVGTAVTPNSATTFLNYFSVLGERGYDSLSQVSKANELTFERFGYAKGTVGGSKFPWVWTNNPKQLCPVELVDGDLSQHRADVHVEFANAFIGGGVMTGDAAMEETLFLIKPELMVAMAIENRMVDEEAIRVSGALQYSTTRGFGQQFEFAGDYVEQDTRSAPPIVCAIDAIRGGGPSMTKSAMLRDMNKARIAFDGAQELATGHWGCGAFGNNHNLMFLKQWLAASEAGVQHVWYHDFSRSSSHHIHPLIRRLKHLTVGELWGFMDRITHDLVPCNMKGFYTRIANIATGKLKVPTTVTVGQGVEGVEEEEKEVEETKEDVEETKEDVRVATKATKVTKATKALEQQNQPEATEPEQCYSLNDLQQGSVPGIDGSKKEEYLSAAEFKRTFGVTLSDFLKLPKWKRVAAKKKNGLF